MVTFRAYLLSTLTAGLAAFTASASVIDQNFISTYNPYSGTGVGLIENSRVAQTFQVDLDGTFAGVAFNLKQYQGTGGLTVDLRSLVSGAPGPQAEHLLATVTIPRGNMDTPWSGPGSWDRVFADFSFANIAVTEGDMLAFVLSSAVGSGFATQTDYSNSYAGGTRWLDYADGNGFVESTSFDPDLPFTTYIDVTPVPEPITLTLLGAGLLGLAATRR